MDSTFWPQIRSTDNTKYDESDLLRLTKTNINSTVIDFFIERVIDVVDYGLRRPSSSRANSNKRPRHSHDQDRDEFASFVTRILRRAEVTMSVILGALVYIERAKPHLRIAIEEWAHHRVFLGSLILASKYLNDSSLKNSHWALCTGVFGKRDIARIEREFLEVLAFQLSVHENDLAPHVEAVRSATSPETVQLKKMRQADLERREMELAYVSSAAKRREVRSRRALELPAAPHHRSSHPSSRGNSPAAASRGASRREWTHHRAIPSSPLMVPSSPISPCDSLDYNSGSSSSSSSSSSSNSSSSSPSTPPSAASLPPPPVFVPSQSHVASPFYPVSPSAGKFSKGRGGSGHNLLDHFPSLPALPRFPSISLSFSSPAPSRPPTTLPPSLGQAPVIPAIHAVPMTAQGSSASTPLAALPMTLYPSCVPFSNTTRCSPMPQPPVSGVPLSTSYSNGHQSVILPRMVASFSSGIRRVPVPVL